MHPALDQLSDRLLIQCRLSHAAAAARIADEHDTGLVLTGSSPEPTVRYLRDQGFDRPILCDADRYSGTRRISAGKGIRPAWCRRQHDLGLTALTDSGYLATRNWTGLRTILRAAARQPEPTIAMLPLAARWFATPSVCDALARVINGQHVPVALAIEHRSDPFGAQYVLRGFLRLLDAIAVPVLLLRCDVSALGALCHGAHAAAIGTVSALRHFYPITVGGGPPPPRVSAFVTPLLSYHRLDTCERVVAGTPELHQLWPCDCPACHGATPAQLSTTEDPPVATTEHSLHAQLRLRAELLRHTGEQRLSAWHEACSHALFVHDQVAETTTRWLAPANLRTWYAVTRDPLPHRTGIPRQPGRRAARTPRPLG
ncbi:hypothetical protein BAY59_15180 [Prauserella coralliicola]|nr:hypothetical protein BAY59_15180 [Prauserella coralliicola]